VDPAEMAAIGEAEDTFVQFEGYINVHAVLGLVDATHFFHVAEPQELAVEAKVHSQDAAIEIEKKVFAFALNRPDVPAFRDACDLPRFLWLRGDRVQNVNAANPATLYEKAERARYGFYFREFRHRLY
jgi:hypothetical protein